MKAKSEIFDYMNPDGYVLVNGDDDLLSQISYKGVHKPVYFGLEAVNDIYASDVMSKGLFGTRAVIHSNLEAFGVEIPLPGGHMVYNALAATGVGRQLGLSKEEIRQGIADVETVGGRSHVISLTDYTLIDDCYNANPVSMKAALDLLTTAFGRKVAILGDMFELGTDEAQLHGQIGAYAVEKGIDVLICTGKLSRHMYEQAKGKGKMVATGRNTELHYFETRDEMLKSLSDILQKGDTILVKASHGMQFEKVVEELKTF